MPTKAANQVPEVVDVPLAVANSDAATAVRVTPGSNAARQVPETPLAAANDDVATTIARPNPGSTPANQFPDTIDAPNIAANDDLIDSASRMSGAKQATAATAGAGAVIGAYALSTLDTNPAEPLPDIAAPDIAAPGVAVPGLEPPQVDVPDYSVPVVGDPEIPATEDPITPLEVVPLPDQIEAAPDMSPLEGYQIDPGDFGEFYNPWDPPANPDEETGAPTMAPWDDDPFAPIPYGPAPDQAAIPGLPPQVLNGTGEGEDGDQGANQSDGGNNTDSADSNESGETEDLPERSAESGAGAEQTRSQLDAVRLTLYEAARADLLARNAETDAQEWLDNATEEADSNEYIFGETYGDQHLQAELEKLQEPDAGSAVNEGQTNTELAPSANFVEVRGDLLRAEQRLEMAGPNGDSPAEAAAEVEQAKARFAANYGDAALRAELERIEELGADNALEQLDQDAKTTSQQDYLGDRGRLLSSRSEATAAADNVERVANEKSAAEAQLADAKKLIETTFGPEVLEAELSQLEELINNPPNLEPANRYKGDPDSDSTIIDAETGVSPTAVQLVDQSPDAILADRKQQSVDANKNYRAAIESYRQAVTNPEADGISVEEAVATLEQTNIARNQAQENLDAARQEFLNPTINPDFDDPNVDTSLEDWPDYPYELGEILGQLNDMKRADPDAVGTQRELEILHRDATFQLDQARQAENHAHNVVLFGGHDPQSLRVQADAIAKTNSRARELEVVTRRLEELGIKPADQPATPESVLRTDQLALNAQAEYSQAASSLENLEQAREDLLSDIRRGSGRNLTNAAQEAAQETTAKAGESSDPEVQARARDIEDAVSKMEETAAQAERLEVEAFNLESWAQTTNDPDLLQEAQKTRDEWIRTNVDLHTQSQQITASINDFNSSIDPDDPSDPDGSSDPDGPSDPDSPESGELGAAQANVDKLSQAHTDAMKNMTAAVLAHSADPLSPETAQALEDATNALGETRRQKAQATQLYNGLAANTDPATQDQSDTDPAEDTSEIDVVAPTSPETGQDTDAASVHQIGTAKNQLSNSMDEVREVIEAGNVAELMGSMGLPSEFHLEVETLLEQDPSGVSNREELLELFDKAANNLDQARANEADRWDKILAGEPVWTGDPEFTVIVATQYEIVSRQLESVGIELPSEPPERTSIGTSPARESLDQAIYQRDKAIQAEQTAREKVGESTNPRDIAALDRLARISLDATDAVEQAKSELRDETTQLLDENLQLKEMAEFADNARQLSTQVDAPLSVFMSSQNMVEVSRTIAEKSAKAKDLQLQIAELEASGQDNAATSRAIGNLADELNRTSAEISLASLSFRDNRQTYEEAMEGVLVPSGDRRANNAFEKQRARNQRAQDNTMRFLDANDEVTAAVPEAPDTEAGRLAQEASQEWLDALRAVLTREDLPTLKDQESQARIMALNSTDPAVKNEADDLTAKLAAEQQKLDELSQQLDAARAKYEQAVADYNKEQSGDE